MKPFLGFTRKNANKIFPPFRFYKKLDCIFINMHFLNNTPGFLKNKYLITGILFLVWMCFFDHYNFLFHSQLSKQKKELEKELYRLKKETSKNKIFLRNMNNNKFMEKYAREHYLMKKKGEDIFMLD